MSRRIERYIELVNQVTTSEVINDETIGRILCLDLGEKRIGVAISDETRTIARSYQVARELVILNRSLTLSPKIV